MASQQTSPPEPTAAAPAIPHNGPCIITTLPNEMLIQILTCLDVPDPCIHWEKSCISSVRLVCHRFNEASTPLLIHRLNVNLMPSSFKRLDNISRHPLMRKGITTVVLSLRIYDQPTTTSYWTSSRSGSRQEHEKFEHMARGYAHHLDVGNECDHPALSHYDNIMKAAKRTYDDRWAEQGGFRMKGEFYNDFAAALGRFPRLRSLQFDAGPEVTLPDNKQNLFERFLAPGQWSARRQNCPYDVPSNMLVVLGEDHSTLGLKGLSIAIPSPRDMAQSGPLRNQRAAVATALKTIEEMAILCSAGYLEEDWVDDKPITGHDDDKVAVRLLKNVIRFYVAPQSLRNITIDLTVLDIGGLKLPLRSLLGPSARPNLHTLVCFAVKIRMSDLKGLLENGNNGCKMKKVMLYGCDLSGGTWEEVLDVLRAEVGVAAVGYPDGGECGAMGREAVKLLFEDDEETASQDPPKDRYERYQCMYSRVRQYLGRVRARNPLREYRKTGRIVDADPEEQEDTSEEVTYTDEYDRETDSDEDDGNDG